MSKYTTGELAKACDVSVRTVQYYDTRGLLIPSELSEGGRRLYTEEDLRKLRIICFLRDMDFSIEHISKLFSEEKPENVISLLIEQQETMLTRELREKETKLEKLTEMKRSLKNIENFSVESLGDIAHIMKNQRKRKRLLIFIIILGILMDIIEVGTLVYGIKTGNWLPLIIGLPIIIGLGIFISYYYFHHVDYICPKCHHIFHPKFRKALWASHTPNTRRLTCPHCGHKGFCVETYAEIKKNERV